VGGELTHPPPAAGWAEASPFATERHDHLFLAPLALHVNNAMLEKVWLEIDPAQMAHIE
jgi:hypothetical protein